MKVLTVATSRISTSGSSLCDHDTMVNVGGAEKVAANERRRRNLNGPRYWDVWWRRVNPKAPPRSVVKVPVNDHLSLESRGFRVGWTFAWAHLLQLMWKEHGRFRDLFQVCPVCSQLQSVGGWMKFDSRGSKFETRHSGSVVPAGTKPATVVFVVYVVQRSSEETWVEDDPFLSKRTFTTLIYSFSSSLKIKSSEMWNKYWDLNHFKC